MRACHWALLVQRTPEVPASVDVPDVPEERKVPVDGVVPEVPPTDGADRLLGADGFDGLDPTGPAGVRPGMKWRGSAMLEMSSRDPYPGQGAHRP